jgi:biopolymer transport protein TolQ
MLINAYLHSDWFGKTIFWGLFLLSALSWTLIIHKGWIFYQVKQLSDEFRNLFSEKDPLELKFTRNSKSVPHPLFEIYKAMKQKTLQIISRNHFFAPHAENVLSEADLGLIEAQIQTTLAAEQKQLEKNLFVLSTVATLGPFLGLLGTVWGILLTFAELEGKGFASSNSAMLSGLSMALATTVIGLLIAIPAFAGYNYLKNSAREYRREMEDFSQLLLATLELQYRKPDHAEKIPTPTR